LATLARSIEWRGHHVTCALIRMRRKLAAYNYVIGLALEPCLSTSWWIQTEASKRSEWNLLPGVRLPLVTIENIKSVMRCRDSRTAKSKSIQPPTEIFFHVKWKKICRGLYIFYVIRSLCSQHSIYEPLPQVLAILAKLAEESLTQESVRTPSQPFYGRIKPALCLETGAPTQVHLKTGSNLLTLPEECTEIIIWCTES